MIEKIRHRGSRRLYEDGDRSGLRPDIAGKAELYLSILDTARTVQELDITGFGLHRLTGDHKGGSVSSYPAITESSSGSKMERPSMWIWWTIIKGGSQCR
jgi:hypothetical protein